MGASALGAAGCSSPWLAGAGAAIDDNLTLLISDLHISGLKDKQQYQIPRLKKVVDEVLKMPALPRRCLVFGDIAWSRGDGADYRASRPLLQPLIDAGIELTLGMGNHDHRQTFATVWPECVARTKVKGAFVSVSSAPDCDFIMLDSLNETGVDEKSYNFVWGALPEQEQEWMRAELPKWPRPFFLCAHHPCTEVFQGKLSQLTVAGRPLVQMLADLPKFIGYIHGHDHRWTKRFIISNWKRRSVYQHLTLPSTGHWGDIGYALMRTAPGSAHVTLHQDDFYFPVDLPPEERAPDWSAMVAANQGANCRFVWRV